MKQSKIKSLVAILLSLIMLLGTLATLPFSASATDASVIPAPNTPPTDETLSKYANTDTEPTQVDNEGYTLITSAAEFGWMYKNAVAGEKYRLTVGIDLDNKLANQKEFAAELDGGNHTISHITCSPNGGVGGLFNIVTGTVKNLVLTSVKVTQTNAATVGSVAGAVGDGGVLENIVLRSGTVIGSTSGGIVGRIAAGVGNLATVRNCVVESTVNLSVKSNAYSNAVIGGIVGYITSGNAVIEGCSNYAVPVRREYENGGEVIYEMSTMKTYLAILGGIVGAGEAKSENYNITVKNCNNYADITSPQTHKSGNSSAAGGDAHVGGIIGRTGNTVVVSGCVNYGNIVATGTDNSRTGGIVGDYTNWNPTSLTIRDCFNFGSVTVTSSSPFAGGFVGGTCDTYAAPLTLENSVNYGNVTISGAKVDSGYPIGRAGGFAGSLGAGASNGYQSVFAYNCAQFGTITANTNGSAAGDAIGFMNIGHDNNSAKGVQIVLYGCLLNGVAAGGRGSGGVVGYITPANYAGARHADVFLQNSVIATVRVTGTASVHGEGAIFGNTWKTSNTPNTFHVENTIIRVEEGQPLSYTGTDYAINEVANVVYTLFTEDMLTNGVAKSVMNAPKTMVDPDGKHPATPTDCIPWIQGALAPVFVTEAEFSGATMTLGENMMLNLKLDQTILDGTGVTSVTFVRNGEATPGNATVDANGYYTASFACDAADLAKSAAYHMVFTAGGKDFVGTNVLNYAPIEYATALYNDEEHPEAQDLIVKMLSMASLSEKAKYGAESNAIATAAGNAEITLPTEYTIPEDMKYYALDADKATEAIDIIDDYAMTGADLNGSVNLVFEVTDASITQVTVTSGDVYNETFEVKDSYVTITGLGAKHIANLITIAFHDANGLVASTDFSVGNYLQNVISNTTDTDTKNLATAMVLYMMSVKAYAGA